MSYSGRSKAFVVQGWSEYLEGVDDDEDKCVGSQQQHWHSGGRNEDCAKKVGEELEKKWESSWTVAGHLLYFRGVQCGPAVEPCGCCCCRRDDEWGMRE